MEYLPILEECNGKLMVRGKVERTLAHSQPPVPHATAVIILLLPSGHVLLAEKTEKQRKKGKEIPPNVYIYDILGGHMTYDNIPEEERNGELSMETFRKCAFRELSEELLRINGDGSREPFIPDISELIPCGLYSMKNDHNWEYSWAFVYQLKDYGPYTSQDTVGDEIIELPLCPVTPDELVQMYLKGKERGGIISDGVGRILEKLIKMESKGFWKKFMK